MSNIEPVLRIEEVRQILSVSAATIYRWLAESRSENGGTFPLPVNTGGRKRRLLWTRDSIMAFLDNRKKGSPQEPLIAMSEVAHQKRHSTACQSLKEQGVKIDNLDQ